jgi:nitrogen regulatory protein PII
MKPSVAGIKPFKRSRIEDGNIFVPDLRSAARICAGETDAAAIRERAPSPLWTGATP